MTVVVYYRFQILFDLVIMSLLGVFYLSTKNCSLLFLKKMFFIKVFVFSVPSSTDTNIISEISQKEKNILGSPGAVFCYSLSQCTEVKK